MLFMKKIQISLAALTLVLAIAGTTTVNATKTKDEIEICREYDPNLEICTDDFPIACCFSEEQDRTINSHIPKF